MTPIIWSSIELEPSLQVTSEGPKRPYLPIYLSYSSGQAYWADSSLFNIHPKWSVDFPISGGHSAILE